MEAIDTDIWPLGALVRAWGKDRVQKALECFTCAKETDASDFLHRHAIEYEDEGRCRTFVVVEDGELGRGELSVVAFFTIAMHVTTVDPTLDDMDGSESDDRPERYPGFLIAQLARNDLYTHEQYDGMRLLRTAEEFIAQASDLVGGTLIFLECKVAGADGRDLHDYYASAGYQEYSADAEYYSLCKKVPT